jgi:microcystin-dependent protein
MCNGQIMAISQNAALYSLLGTTYGGNGTTTFGLPDLRGNIPVCFGQGLGLSPYALGQRGGTPNVTLLDLENPSHNHLLNATTNSGTTADPSGNVYAKGVYNAGARSGAVDFYTPTVPAVTLKPTTLGTAGGSLPHNNLMPSLTLNFCIALQGIFPSRN